MISDQTNDVAEWRRVQWRQPYKAARAGRGPEERGEGHAEPVGNRRVLRRLLDAAVHDQLRAGVLLRVSGADAAAPRLHHPVAPQLGRQPAAVRLSPEGLPARVQVAADVQRQDRSAAAAAKRRVHRHVRGDPGHHCGRENLQRRLFSRHLAFRRGLGRHRRLRLAASVRQERCQFAFVRGGRPTTIRPPDPGSDGVRGRGDRRVRARLAVRP